MAMTNGEINKELKDLAIKACEKIPSNDKILYKSEGMSHVIEREIDETGEALFEKHIIKIEWVQIQDKESEEKE